MNIKPVGKRVLVEVEKPKKTTRMGIIVTDETQISNNYGKITQISDEIKDFNIDENILFDKDKSMEVRFNDKVQYIVNIEDIFAKVEGE